MGTEVTECHHEQWDGSGYPHGTKGEDIPLSARILALADFYDALTTDRPYRGALKHDQVREMILSQSNKHFDPCIVEAFVGIENEFIQTNSGVSDSNSAANVLLST